MSIIEVNHVSKKFSKPYEKTLKGQLISMLKREKVHNQFDALKDVTFDVKESEGFAIIGHNGAGKSTLFKILSGIIHPDSGEIKVKGSVAPLIELSAGLHPDLSGLENINLNCAILGIEKEKIDEITPKIIEFSELEDFINVPVKYYSSGMKARLGFSIAVHNDADILLIDEVLSVGDKEFKKKCNEKMLEMKKEGKTIVIVSHSLKSLKKLCDRAMILKKGQVVDIGDFDKMVELYETKVSKKKPAKQG
ncbi:ABC transporter ATP-binding protein [Fictibacillus sp. Mic-4]|uniref:ABC transporter ATP-binding protein n=1 Tax=Fictibacillus TaxID=1329200 RepID=UPI0003FA5D2D|nr:ABC transporter ATP-binding protein [Fictibacillus gelatini]